MNSYQRDMVKGGSFVAGLIGIFSTGVYVGLMLGGNSESSITAISGPSLILMAFIGWKASSSKSKNP